MLAQIIFIYTCIIYTCFHRNILSVRKDWIYHVSCCHLIYLDLLPGNDSRRQGNRLFGPRQANLVLIAYASSEGSGEPAHPRSLARTSAARSYKQWIKRNLQTESQIPGPSEWLGMRSWNLSWRNARRHKFAWRGSFITQQITFCFRFI